MSRSLIQEKSFSFSVRIVPYCRTRLPGKEDIVLTRQLLRSGTSIGANVEEGLGGQSRKDFIAKLGVAAREARETHYWLRLIQEINTEPDLEAISLEKECGELLKILNSIILTTRRRVPSVDPKPRSKTPDTKLGHELKTQNSQCRTSGIQSADELNSQDSELRTQNFELPRAKRGGSWLP